MTDRPDVSPWRKLIGTTLLSSLFVLPAPVLAQENDSEVAEDPSRIAAEDAANCLKLRDPEIRLACFDAAARRIAESLESSEQGSSDQDLMNTAEQNAASEPTVPDAPEAPDAPPAVEPSVDVAEDLQSVPDAPSAAAPSAEAAEDLPDWAAAPEPQKSYAEQAEVPRTFEASIVRITRNNVGRHRFYTADGAVWEQTQLVEVRAPKSLPVAAEFNRRFTGNPTIQLEGSSRSYRVRRIE